VAVLTDRSICYRVRNISAPSFMATATRRDGRDQLVSVIRTRIRVSLMFALVMVILQADRYEGSDGGHEKLPGDGQIAARWRP
jgi:hypothetical protein